MRQLLHNVASLRQKYTWGAEAARDRGTLVEAPAECVITTVDFLPSHDTMGPYAA